MLAYVTRWFSLSASLPVALAFLKDSSVPVSNSRSAWFGVATSGILVFSLLVWVELRLRLTFGSVARHAVWFAANGFRVALAQVGTLRCKDTPARCDFAELLAGLRKDRFRLGQMLNPAQDHVAVGRRDLAAVASAAQHVGCGHRGSAPEKGIEDHIAGIGERFYEELHQRTRE